MGAVVAVGQVAATKVEYVLDFRRCNGCILPSALVSFFLFIIKVK